MLGAGNLLVGVVDWIRIHGSGILQLIECRADSHGGNGEYGMQCVYKYVSTCRGISKTYASVLGGVLCHIWLNLG